ncbi:UrcA family protein [Parasphingorhabdus sp.]|uniref:UrcA family protein n=1 Tax=Parasphingorhabdus sp. TaxID=2709688 RepID=UPI0032640584
MKNAKFSLIAGLSIVSIFGPALVCAPAHATSLSEPVHKQLIIPVNQIDLSSPKGIAEATKLVRREARRACYQTSSRFSEVKRAQSECMKKVMQDAATQIEILHRSALFKTGVMLAENANPGTLPGTSKSCRN